MRSLFRYILIIVLSGFLPVACYNCDNNYLGKYRFEINAIESIRPDTYPYDSTSVFSGDSITDTIMRSPHLVFDLIFRVTDEKITSIYDKSELFTSSSYALSVQECYDMKNYTIQHKIDSIVIRSDTSFNYLPAGANLNRYFIVYPLFQDPLKDLTFNQLVTYLNTGFEIKNVQCYGDTLANSWCRIQNTTLYLRLYLNQRPTGGNNHRFSIYLYKSNGDVLIRTTPKRIVWL